VACNVPRPLRIVRLGPISGASHRLDITNTLGLYPHTEHETSSSADLAVIYDSTFHVYILSTANVTPLHIVFGPVVFFSQQLAAKLFS
jgi:hypothetical protein